MLAKIAFFAVLGKPLAMLFGLSAFLIMLSAAAVAVLGMKGKVQNHFIWHVRLARLGIGLAVVHLILVMAMFIK